MTVGSFGISVGLSVSVDFNTERHMPHSLPREFRNSPKLNDCISVPPLPEHLVWYSVVLCCVQNNALN